MRIFDRIVALILCVSLVLSLCACGNRAESSPSVEESDSDAGSSPEIEVSVIDGPSEASEDSVEAAISAALSSGEITDIYSLVCSSVSYKLENAGFYCDTGVAATTENENYAALGLYYYDDTLNIFQDDTMKAVGFLEVVDENEPFVDASREESLIVVTPVSEMQEDADEEVAYICTYNYESIGSSHFVYKNRYVQYYQETPMRVVYTVQDNTEENYDLSLGSLYDFDKGEYIYDEGLWGEYTTHSATELFNEKDYTALEAELQQISEQQMQAGYVVEEYKIVYISPEAIQAYLDSNEEDTFFGYSVAELTSTFGLGNTLEYTENGFVEASVWQGEDGKELENYNWNQFLSKVGVGCGIILVGAILTPVTGGASFGCALVTITSLSAGFGLTSALGSLAIETAKGLSSGKLLKDAIIDARVAGLNGFANGFMIGAAIGTVGVTTGVIKPIAGEKVLASIKTTVSPAMQKTASFIIDHSKEIELTQPIISELIDRVLFREPNEEERQLTKETVEFASEFILKTLEKETVEESTDANLENQQKNEVLIMASDVLVKMIPWVAEKIQESKLAT